MEDWLPLDRARRLVDLRDPRPVRPVSGSLERQAKTKQVVSGFAPPNELTKPLAMEPVSFSSQQPAQHEQQQQQVHASGSLSSAGSSEQSPPC